MSMFPAAPHPGPAFHGRRGKPREKHLESPLKRPECGSRYVAVAYSRPASGNTIRRRRCCSDCNARWTTYEISADIILKLKSIDTIRKSVAELSNALDAIAGDLPTIEAD